MKQRQDTKEKRKVARKPRGSAVIQQLQRALQDFLKRRMCVGGGDINVRIAADLIFMRCREAISPSEVEVGSLQVGRLLLQEVNERKCREVQPELGRLLYRITELRLLDMKVVTFFRRKEKIYVLAMSDRLR